MRLLSLEIHNYRTIIHCQLDFEDKLTGIIGRNGAGKSSLIEAIAWALYGNQAARSGKDEIKSIYAGSDDSCSVSLSFMVHDELYRVERKLVGKNDRAEVQLFRGEQSESVGVSETKAYVGQILGLDWRGFLTSFLARQSELNALSDLQPAKRRDHLAGMLGIERLDQAINSVKSDSRIQKEQTAFLERHLSEKEHLLKDIAIQSEQLEQMKANLSKSTQEFEETKKILQTAENEYLKISRLKDQYLLLVASYQAEDSSAKLIAEQITARKTELSELNGLELEINTLKPVTQLLQQKKQELSELKKIEASLTVKINLDRQIAAKKNSIVTLEKELANLQQQIEQSDTSIQTFPENLAEQETKLTEMLETAREQYSEYQAELLACDRNLEKLNKQLKQITELGTDSICDRCLRPLGEDYHTISEHLKSDSQKLQQSKTELAQKLKIALKDGTEIKTSLADLQNKRRELERLKLTVQNLKTNRNKNLTDKQQVENEVTELSDQIKAIGAQTVKPEQVTSCEHEVIELEEKSNRLNHINGQLSRKPSLLKELNEQTEKYNQVLKKSDVLKQQMAELGFDESVFQKSAEIFKVEQEKFEQAQKVSQAAVHRFELVQQDLEAKMTAMQKFTETEKELEALRTAVYHGEKLTVLLTEYRKQLITSIRPTLAETTSELLAEMTDQKYSFVELDEQYNLRVMDQGQFYEIERFSGGEKDLANLCLRLAISIALTEAAGLDRSFIILDEVFGSQDPVRKELIIEALSRLKKRFPQIILVTHIEDIKDGVEQIIEVVQTDGGYSEVRCNGALQN